MPSSLDTPTSIRALQATGLTLSAYLSGFVFSCSAIGAYPLYRQLEIHTQEPQDDIPRVIEPAFYARHFKIFYDIGHGVAPLTAAAATSIYLSLAYAYRKCPSLASIRSRDTSNQYILAAALTIGIVPFTLAVMLPTNKRLFALQQPQPTRNDKTPDEASKETTTLLKTWSKMNLARSVILLSGTAAAWSATLF